MPARDPRRDIVAGAASRLIEALAEDEAFAAWVANDEIQRRVDAGELVPIETLQMAGGLELVPKGAVAELRALLLELASHPKVKKISDLASLLEVCVAVASPATVKVTPRKSTKKVEAVPPPDVETPPPVDGDPERERMRRPRGMPEGPQKCVVCDDTITDEQLRISWTRHRAPVCRSDMADYKPTSAA